MLFIIFRYWHRGDLYRLSAVDNLLFKLSLILKNKTQRQTHIALDYIVVQYHFEPHPPFKAFLEIPVTCARLSSMPSSTPSTPP